jgi:hypothetical protein
VGAGRRPGAFVVALAFVPNGSRTVPVIAGTAWFLVQVAFLGRSRTVGFLTLVRFCLLGAALAAPIGLVSLAVNGIFGWQPWDSQPAVFAAGPVDEPLKLLPIAFFGLVAWNRIRGWSAADFAVAGPPRAQGSTSLRNCCVGSRPNPEPWRRSSQLTATAPGTAGRCSPGGGLRTWTVWHSPVMV